MGLGSILGSIGAAVAAPFTGGASLALLPALSAAGGALENTQGARTSTSTPTIAPGYQSLADLLKARAMSRLQGDTDMGGYTANGIAGINKAYGNVGTGLNANLTARGLANSPVAGAAMTKLQTARGGDIASFMNTIPLLQRQFQNEDMSNALGQVTQLGRGTSNVGAGSALGGAFSSAAEMLAYLQGKGVLGGGGTNLANVGNIIGNNRTSVLGTMQPMEIPGLG